ncbi:hypothetical protein ACFV9D_14830 [Streptomyces sp. NPDC059875]|uniref:hypothetical protein n=1 Tax=unclassified Streptomyces TaxID=2593676 RepID=UPI003652DBC3
MSNDDHRAAGASQATGATGRRRRHAPPRRRAGARWAIAGGGVVGLGLLVAVVAGAFRAGETGGGPAGGDGHPGLPSLIQADPSGTAEPGDEGEATGAPRQSAPAGTGATTASAGPSATPSGTATATASPTVAADGAEAGAGEKSEKPGKSGSAPGATKRPR